MRAVLQRVSRASVSWGTGRNEIGLGLLVLLGVGPADDESVADRLAEKIAQLRIFEDAGGKTNLSLEDVGGQALVVSQFTLYADVSRGRRPGFNGAAPPDLAERLYEHFVSALGSRGVSVLTGSFGAEMDVELTNRGPFTLVVDTDNLSR